ncbi:MAG: methyltransferase domain-containing protein [Methanomassiliicoccus sp.]|nr:methyltransferase domain-containing protein [Methanomassiliicoccus sp.]
MSWKEEWAMAHRLSPLRVTPENESRWERYWSVCAAQYGRDVEAEAHLYQAVIDHLVREGRLRSTDTVLDIGCGPGTYTLPIARRSRRAVGLDTAPGMIAELMERAKEQRSDNVEGIVGRWEDLGAGDYGLVLSALSPAVRDADSLLRMGSVTKRDCCYITAALGEEMRTRNELWEKVVGAFRPSHAYDVKYPLNILMEEGCRPDLKHISASFETVVDADVAISNFQVYFEIFTEMGDEKRAVIKDFILDRSEDGAFRRSGKKTLAIMTWTGNEEC